jgi:hypothetical protein
VPVVQVTGQSFHLGGAGNVRGQTSQLGGAAALRRPRGPASGGRARARGARDAGRAERLVDAGASRRTDAQDAASSRTDSRSCAPTRRTRASCRPRWSGARRRRAQGACRGRARSSSPTTRRAWSRRAAAAPSAPRPQAARAGAVVDPQAAPFSCILSAVATVVDAANRSARSEQVTGPGRPLGTGFGAGRQLAGGRDRRILATLRMPGAVLGPPTRGRCSG